MDYFGELIKKVNLTGFAPVSKDQKYRSKYSLHTLIRDAIGPPDLSARLAHWQSTLAPLDQRGVDIEKIAKMTEGYTPGDVDLAAQRAAAAAFDRIREGKKPLHITSEDLEAAVARTRPSVTAEIRDRFAEEVGRFARV